MLFPMNKTNRLLGCSILLVSAVLLSSACAPRRSAPVTPAISGSTIIKGPFLIYPAVNTQMTVHWQTDKIPADSKIAWGRDSGCRDGSAVVAPAGTSTPGLYDFHYTISALKPGKKVCYRVTADSQSASGSFYAAPTDTATRLVFYGMGDSQPKTALPVAFDTVCAKILRDVKADAAKRQTLVLHGGDFVFRGRVEGDWAKDHYNRSYANIVRLESTLPIMGAIGNHEFYDINEKTDNTYPNPFIDRYLPYPYQARYYYSYDYGPLHVAVVDNYIPYEVGSVQYQWLAKDLAGSTKPWKIVTFHEPAYGNDNDVTAIQTNLHPLFIKQNIKMVLQAHIHAYCRCLKDGIQYVTLGGGGAPLHRGRGPAGTYDPALIQKDAFVDHFARFVLDGDSLKATVIDTKGGVIDSFSVRL